MIIQFLDSLPETFASTRDIHSATGAAMQAALKLMVSRILLANVLQYNNNPNTIQFVNLCV
jgi:hypothetical protein